MKIALTGASGHLGASLVKELHERGMEIRALVREDDRTLKNHPAETVKGDLVSFASMQRLVKGCDGIIHAAANISIHGDPDGNVHRTNVEGTRQVLKAAMEAGIRRFIHISSIHAFNQQPTHEKLDETRTLVNEKAYAYDRSKREGQELVLKACSGNFHTLVINPTAIIGPPDFKPSLLGKAIIDMYKGKIPAVIDGGFDFCDARDVANAIVNSISRGTPGQNYLLGGKWHSMKSFSSILSKASGKKISLPSLPVSLAKAGLPFIKLAASFMNSDPLYTSESIEALVHGNRKICYDKAINDLGYKTRPLEETMQDAFIWFHDHGYLN